MVVGEDRIAMRGVLVAMVRVQEQAGWNGFCLLGRVQSLQNRAKRVLPPELVGDDEAIEQILDRGQIGPTASGGNIGDIRDPFLDVKSIALGLGLPAKWKVHKNKPAKFLLRQAFSTDLPYDIVNRPKQKFSKGAGSSAIIGQIAEHEIPDAELHSERAWLYYYGNYRLPNKEALYYYRILRQFYQDKWILPTMGRSRSL